MATDFKRLIKKKALTGEDIGRIFLADLAQAHKSVLEGKEPIGILTPEARQDLTQRLATGNLAGPNSIGRYNNLKNIYDYLSKLPAHYASSEFEAESCFWQLYHIIEKARIAEMDSIHKRWSPKIVTQTQYEKIVEGHIKAEMARTISVEDLVIETIVYYIGSFKQKHPTPFDEYFKESQKIPLTNSRLKRNYTPFGGYFKWPEGSACDISHEAYESRQRILKNNAFTAGKEATVEQILESIRERKRHEIQEQAAVWVENIEAPDDATMYDSLVEVEIHYGSDWTKSEQAFFELRRDYPKFFEAIMSFLTESPGLSFIKDIPESDYVTGTDRIPLKILYDNEMLARKSILDFISYKGRPLAILKSHTPTDLKYRTDDIGFYDDPDKDEPGLPGIQLLLEIYSQDIISWLSTIKERYREMYAIHTFLALVSEMTGVPGLVAFIRPIDEAKLETINAQFNEFMDHVFVERHGDLGIENLPEAFDTIEAIHEVVLELLQPISISSLQPTEEQVKHAKETISYDTFKGGARDFIISLMGREDEE